MQILNRFSKKQLAIQILLFAGLAVALYLIGQRTIFRSRANEVFNAVEVKDAQGNTLDCSNGTCETQTLDIEIRLDREALEN